MKFEIWRGCTSYSTIIDGKCSSELNEKELEDVVDHLLKKVKEAIIKDCTVQLDSLIEIFQYDDYEDHGHCDQCFDNVYSTHYEI